MKNFISPSGNIYIDSIHHGLTEHIAKLNPNSIHIIADENTSRHCVPLLQSLINAPLIVVPAGEHFKSLDSCARIWEQLIVGKAQRNSIVLNVGGGMICDLGGFAAACYMRGIKFAHIPTSVLAMTDAAIGGKTGIDFYNLKNYIGLIRLPEFIWIDPVFLHTLPEHEKISGLSEIVKHAIIGSHELWKQLMSIASVEAMPWNEILEKSIPVKMKIVEEDPQEFGLRKILNFGHTVGHAIESYHLSLSNPVSHGDCVATGIIIEAKISNRIGLLNNDDLNNIVKLVSRLLKPFRNTFPTFADLIPYMAMDKKNSGSGTRFSLPDSIGSCLWDIPVENELIQDSFEWFAQGRVEP